MQIAFIESINGKWFLDCSLEHAELNTGIAATELHIIPLHAHATVLWREPVKMTMKRHDKHCHDSKFFQFLAAVIGFMDDTHIDPIVAV